MKIHKPLNKFKNIILAIVLSTLYWHGAVAQSLTQQARNKINTLTELIDKAEAQNIQTEKERMKIRVAELYLIYADWDDANVDVNKEAFRKYKAVSYTSDLTINELAELLPDKQRTDVIELLEEAIAELNSLLRGETIRKPSNEIVWDNMEIKDSRVISNGKPVFINDWIFKTPKINEFDTREYFGNVSGFYFTPTHIQKNSNGELSLKSWVKNALEKAKDNNFGDPFIGQNLPQFIIDDYPEILDGKTQHTRFNIDHPEVRPIFEALFKEVVPELAGKQASAIGYGLTNEPHWNTSGTWAIVDISDNTKKKFSSWLRDKHGSLRTMNERWKTNFTSFDKAAFSIRTPIPKSIRGTAKWYDFMRFNQWRVTQWFDFLHSEIKKHDPNAKTHIKLIPAQWSGNARDNGLNFEELTEMTELIGNDASTSDGHSYKRVPWMEDYDMDWIGMAMSYDFFNSIKPNAVNYNSEGHMITNSAYTDLFQEPSYVYACHWLATIQGMDINKNWAWHRLKDGASDPNWTSTGQVGQLPKTLATVHSMIIDLNANSEEMSLIQEMPAPLRLFYSETSAINKADHMTQTQELYESLFFEGHRMGFATEKIIDRNLQKWKVLIISNTEYVKESELEALQAYLDRGGIILIDTKSLMMDEYGELHTLKLSSSNGQLITVADEQIKDEALRILKEEGEKLIVEVTEDNKKRTGFKGVVHRSIKTADGRNIITLVNLGNEDATITLSLDGSTSSLPIMNMINGVAKENNFTMQPEDVLLLEVGGNRGIDNKYKIISGTYTIQNSHNGENLIGPDRDNFNVSLYDAGSWEDQQWIFKHVGNSQHTIKNVDTEKFLEVYNGGCTNNTNVKTWKESVHDHQKWYIQSIGGKYYLNPVHCPSMALDKGSGDKGNAKVHSFNKNFQNQQWKLLPVGSSRRLEDIVDKSKEEKGFTLSIFPNPGNDIIELKVNDTIGDEKVRKVTLETMTGKVLQSFDALPHEISLKKLRAGSYLIKVITEDGLIYERINKL